jgi:hypothetical protein
MALSALPPVFGYSIGKMTLQPKETKAKRKKLV